MKNTDLLPFMESICGHGKYEDTMGKRVGLQDLSSK